MNQSKGCLLTSFLKNLSAEPISLALSPVRRERRGFYPAVVSHWSTGVLVQLPLCLSLTGRNAGSSLIKGSSGHLVCPVEGLVQPLSPISSPPPAVPSHSNMNGLPIHIGSESKESAGNAGDPGSIPGLGRSPGERNGNPLQYSCLENSMDREA